ncbi:MAG TPA: hypothetical protein VIB39_01695 [Candidatus Angelobacter sp.]|jgi:hypothetical protein
MRYEGIHLPARWRRHTLLIIFVVLCAVAIWWIFVFPHTRWYRNRKDESLTKARLQKIKPPAGDRLTELTTSHQWGWPSATAIYSTNSDCARLKRYYKEEFAGQGFAFEDERRSLQSSPELDSLDFSDHGYSAGMICDSSEKPLRSYMIIVTLNSRVDKEIPLHNPMDGDRR